MSFIKPDPAFMEAITSHKADDFLRRIRQSVTFGPKPPTLEHLHGPYYILHCPGHGYMSGRDWRYGRASHELLDLRKDDGDNQYRTFCGCKVNMDYSKEGRFLKADRAKWLADVKEFMS